MKSLSGKELAKLLETPRLAIAPSSRQSSHLRQANSILRLSIPIHGNKSLKAGLLRRLLKMAGIDEDAVQ